VFYDRRVRLVSELVGALGAGALVFLLIRQAGLGTRRAFAAVAIVPVVIAGLLAAPALRESTADLLNQREVNAPLTDEQAQLQPGAAAGMNVAFLAWVHAHFFPDDTFQMVVGSAPGETLLEGAGVREGLILQWSLFQLAPNLAVEEDPDWIVFYESSPEDDPAVKPGDVITYAPNFAIARSSVAR
jgi:hypothetical protein